MMEIPLTQGLFALIDDEDARRVGQFRWHAVFRKRGSLCYAQRNIGSRAELLHRFVLNLKLGDPQVDHRDGNGLNCQKINLRLATAADNARNRGMSRNNKSGYKGVVFSPRERHRNKPWEARIMVDYHIIFLGNFETPEEAARAYDTAAVKHHGEFAYLNFPVISAVSQALR